VNQNGHSYDVMKVKNAEDGTEQAFYFNVDIPSSNTVLRVA